MQVLGNTMEHVRLVSRMAQATGTDLMGATQAGKLSQEEWADMVQTCRSCVWSERCPDWLACHERVDAAPDTCLNRAEFAALKSQVAPNEPMWDD